MLSILTGKFSAARVLLRAGARVDLRNYSHWEGWQKGTPGEVRCWDELLSTKQPGTKNRFVSFWEQKRPISFVLGANLSLENGTFKTMISLFPTCDALRLWRVCHVFSAQLITAWSSTGRGSQIEVFDGSRIFSDSDLLFSLIWWSWLAQIFLKILKVIQDLWWIILFDFQFT